MSRPAKELEILSLQMRGDAFVVAGGHIDYLKHCVRMVASAWEVKLSDAEVDVIADHLKQDMFELGRNLGFLNGLIDIGREVKDDYAKDYEDED